MVAGKGPRASLHCACDRLGNEPPHTPDAMMKMTAAIVRRLAAHPRDRVDWGAKDGDGQDFRNLAARESALSDLYPLVKDQPYYVSVAKPLVLACRPRDDDWDVLSNADCSELLRLNPKRPGVKVCGSALSISHVSAPLESALQEAIEEESRAMTEAEDERISASAANVMVEGVPGMGNSVVAHSDLLPPTVLEELRNPFSVGVYEEVCGERSGGCCVHCASSLPLSGEGSMLGCSQCEMVRYCSPSCHSSHQAQHAAYECAALSKLKRVLPQLRERSVDVPENFFELSFHCITTLAALRSHCEGRDVVNQLESHTQEVAQHTHPTARVVYDLLNGEVPEERIATVIGITTCNAVEVVDDHTGQGVAQGLYASAASFFNHSCHPNCSLDAGRHTIVNIRRVKSGQQLCISYIPQLYWPASRRQAALQDHFFFSCRCERCETSQDDAFEKCLEMKLPNSSSTTTVTSSSELVSRVEAACQTIRSLSIAELTPKHTKEVEGMLQEVGHHFFGSHYIFQEIHNTLSFLYTASEEYEKCFYSCMRELLLWECVVSGALPVKRMKAQNALACLSSMSTEQVGKAMRSCLLAPHLSRLAHMYGVEDEEE